MKKLNKDERIQLAGIYNTEGKKKMYEVLREKYLISNPSQVFAVMKKAPYLLYDAKLDRFDIKDLETNEANIFLDIDSLCSGKGKTIKTSNTAKDEHTVYKSMESLVQELIGERLLTLSQYVTLDTNSKILHLDKTSLTNDGYQLILH